MSTTLVFLSFLSMHLVSGSDTLFIKHDDFAEESFALQSATYNYYQVEDSDLMEFVIKVEVEKALSRDPELQSAFNANPNIEATAVIPVSAFKLEEGTRIFQEFGYDSDRDENLSILYYFAHNSIEQLEIKVLELEETSMKAQVSGVSAINSGDWQKPDASIRLETTFRRDPDLKRSFN